MMENSVLYKVFSTLVATFCAYETVAIITKRAPTLSKLCLKYPILIPVILIGLAIHFDTHGALSNMAQRLRN